MKFQTVAHHDSDLNVKVIVIEGKSIISYIRPILRVNARLTNSRI